MNRNKSEKHRAVPNRTEPYRNVYFLNFYRDLTLEKISFERENRIVFRFYFYRNLFQ